MSEAVVFYNPGQKTNELSEGLIDLINGLPEYLKDFFYTLPLSEQQSFEICPSLTSLTNTLKARINKLSVIDVTPTISTGLMNLVEQLSADLKEFFHSLSPEEQKNLNALSGLNALTATLKGMKDTDIPSDAKEQAKVFGKLMSLEGSEPEQLSLNICHYPTDLCRVSPFFPMSKQEMSNREFIEDMRITTQNSWGFIHYTGPKLSTYEQDILMAVLAVINTKRELTDVDDKGEIKQTYTYKGPFAPILRLRGVKGKIGKTNYQQALKSLEYLVSGVVKLTVSKATTRGHKRPKVLMFSNMISNVSFDEESSHIQITVNPYFYESMYGGYVTFMDVEQRARLNSPVAKLMFNFIKSHKDKVWEGHYKLLAEVVNLDLNDPAYVVRQAITRGLSELIKEKVLSPQSGIKRDRVRLERLEPTKKAIK